MKPRIDEKIKVFIFSEQPLFRDGIKNWLSSKPDIEVIGDANVTNTTILLSIQLMPPEVVIIDIDNPANSGLDLARRLIHLLPDVKVIALRSTSNDIDLTEALKVKLSAYLSKNVSGDNLLNIVRRVAHQGDFIDTNLITRPGVIKNIIRELQELSDDDEIQNPLSPLRRRETQVISYISKGYSNKEIGAILGISQQTVKTHVSSIMTKLEAKDRAEAAVKAVTHNWIVNIQD